ncbi:MAG: hypothetical protein ACK4YP_13975 [Myxococcota bacterium]
MSVDLCRHLRWKERYGLPFRTDADLLASFLTAGVPFTCNRTCQTWGPDDDLVAPEGCARSRGCFEPTPGRGVT